MYRYFGRPKPQSILAVASDDSIYEVIHGFEIRPQSLYLSPSFIFCVPSSGFWVKKLEKMDSRMLVSVERLDEIFVGEQE